MGFFELCLPGTEHKKCALGKYCQCAFYAEFFSGFSDEELSPEEERAMYLEIEIRHIKRKYDDDPIAIGWMKYYPYHLDPNYDDENGNPNNYRLEDEDEEDDDDRWWRQVFWLGNLAFVSPGIMKKILPAAESIHRDRLLFSKTS